MFRNRQGGRGGQGRGAGNQTGQGRGQGAGRGAGLGRRQGVGFGNGQGRDFGGANQSSSDWEPGVNWNQPLSALSAGVPAAEKKSDNPDQAAHEKEGIEITRRILEDISLDRAVIEHVCRIVGSHHSGGDIDTIEFKIVYDADLIVNMQENYSAAGITSETFLTTEGAALAEKLYKKD